MKIRSFTLWLIVGLTLADAAVAAWLWQLWPPPQVHIAAEDGGVPATGQPPAGAAKSPGPDRALPR